MVSGEARKSTSSFAAAALALEASTAVAKPVTLFNSAGNGPTVDGRPLDYVPPGSPVWLPCSRNNAASPDSIGVSLSYDYSMVTPLSSVARFFGGSGGGGTISMSDRTIMALNP